MLNADTWRQYGRHGRLLAFKGFLTRRSFRPIVTLRLCQAAQRGGLPGRLLLPFYKLLHKAATQLAGMDFAWQTQVGPGLALTHGWGLVINPGARIGSNVTMFHGVTLGQRDRIAADGSRVSECPVIEDEVWIGPHAIIVGGVRIGRGSRIGGGAFVTEDVPPYSVVAGNPAAIVKTGCVPDVMNRADIGDSAPAAAQLTGLHEQS
ncbi:DapH/DapD/GlmU-related protein [Massilia endophytica]|uniref:DapH/DapD/GlmU-related protein n=1 Tax=Massilia endophytica TaxID=2899220 RepID=UPI001E3C4A59|nr:DapH/DapD/GlmU-related protein [Massilia endophytica]UGQ49187.1 serine acetyltransferase [Massilia endophytica]